VCKVITVLVIKLCAFLKLDWNDVSNLKLGSLVKRTDK